MARLVVIKGDGPEWLIDLDKNPRIEAGIEAGELRIVKELKSLPPDPWTKKTVKQGKDESAEKPLAKMNHDELEAVLEAEHIDKGEASTKREIVAVIEAAREAAVPTDEAAELGDKEG